jgi:hypothetical protein
MATIATILIRVISLLGKQNELTREVFWWLVAGREHLMIFFPPKKPKMHAGRRCPQSQCLLISFSGSGPQPSSSAVFEVVTVFYGHFCLSVVKGGCGLELQSFLNLGFRTVATRAISKAHIAVKCSPVKQHVQKTSILDPTRHVYCIQENKKKLRILGLMCTLDGIFDRMGGSFGYICGEGFDAQRGKGGRIKMGGTPLVFI